MKRIALLICRLMLLVILSFDLQSQVLINVDFGVGQTSLKTGFAATGQSNTDYWNLYSRDDGQGGFRTFGAINDLLLADGSPSQVDITVANAPGAWGTGSSDPLLYAYLYPFNGGNITVTVTGVPEGRYDLF